MVSEHEVVESLHATIHGLRMLSSYKPTQFEMKVSYLISTLYESKCLDCKNVMTQKRIEAEKSISGDKPINNPNLLSKLFGRNK